MFSETQIQLNQTRFRDAFSNADYLFRLAAEDFIEFLPTIKSPPKRVLILGEFPLFSELTAKYPEILIDINCVFAHTPNIPSKHRYDIIVSMGQLH